MRYLTLIFPLLCLTALPAVAAEPFCNVEETCTVHKDNCEPAKGRLTIKVQPSGKGLIALDGNAPVEATILQMNGKTMLISTNDGEEHQLRISDDGGFNYLITTPDTEAETGRSQIMYRGQCVEG
jgi:hypothetical protein